MVGAVLCASLLATAAPRSRAEEGAATPARVGNDNRRLPANLPMRAEPPATGVDWPPALAWLGLAGAAGGLWWWLRAGGRALQRRSETKGHGLVRLSSQALTPHASVHAVRWHGEEYLLACTSQEVTLVSRRQARAEEA